MKKKTNCYDMTKQELEMELKKVDEQKNNKLLLTGLGIVLTALVSVFLPASISIITTVFAISEFTIGMIGFLKENAINTTLNNRIDKINLLKDFKRELNNYKIGINSEQINREIDIQQNIIDELSIIQNVKKKSIN